MERQEKARRESLRNPGSRGGIGRAAGGEAKLFRVAIEDAPGRTGETESTIAMHPNRVQVVLDGEVDRPRDRSLATKVQRPRHVPAGHLGDPPAARHDAQVFVRRRDLEPITDDLSLIMAFLMGLDAKLDKIEELIPEQDDDDEEQGTDA